MSNNYWFYEELPSTIAVGGNFLTIETDFRVWIKFAEVINSGKATLNDIVFPIDTSSLENCGEFTKEELENALVGFYTYSPKYPVTSETDDTQVVDYVEDAPYIYASFMAKYHIDLMTEEMHWWKFQSLLHGMFNSYSDIIGYRAYSGDDKDMIKMKNMWKIQEVRPNCDKSVVNTLLHGGDFTKGD